MEDVGQLEKWRSVDEVAEYLGIRRDSIYKLIVRKALPAHKVGRLWKMKLTEVDQWVRTNKKSKKKG